MDRLKAFSIFKTVVDQGGFARAAAVMNLSCAAVTRTVQELEALLGVRLLQRTTRRVSLTAVGQEVLERASVLLASYEELAAVSSLSATEPAGAIRMAAPAAYGRCHLGPALAAFMARCPKVWVDLRLREGPIDATDDEADLALCLARDLRPSWIARPVAVAPVGTYAAPRYLARRGEPVHPDDLADHDCLTCDGQRAGWQFHHPGTGERAEAPGRSALQSNHAEVLVQAAVHGAGLVQLPAFMVDEAVALGQLRRVLPDWSCEPVSVHLVYGSRRNQPLAVRLLIEHLVQWLGATDGVPGTRPGRPRSVACAGVAVA